VGAGVEGGEFFFDEGKDFPDVGPLGLPGEVDGHGGALVGHARPEFVGGDGAELGDEEMRGDAVAELFDGEDGLPGAVAGDEVFGLQLGSAAGGEVHFEVREALVPGAGDAHLFGAVFGGVAGEGVEVAGGGFCAEELGGEGVGFAGFETVFDPDLGDAVVLPVGEEADAVAAEEDLVEMFFEVGHGEVFVDDLSDLEGGLDVEGDVGDDAEGAEVDDGSAEDVGVGGAGEGVEGAVGGDELDGGDGGGEVFVVAAGAVGGGGAGSDDGDVGEGGEVVDGETAGVDDGGELAVGDSGADGDGVGGGVEGDVGEVFEGDLGSGAVGDAVEGVAAAEGPELWAGGDEVLDFGGGFGLVEVVGVEGIVAGPVGAGRGGGGLFGRDEAGEHGSGKDRT